MFHGLRTAIYRAEDLVKAKEWYAEVPGFEPYFDEPFYVGFEVGGYELGLLPEDSPEPRSGADSKVYWGVDDACEAVERLVELGASRHEDVRDVGEGILLATVLDPFGNVLGVIENPRFPAA